MRALIMGPPGAGKGTQAALVAGKLEIPTISTGDIFRQNLREGTPLGLEARKYMDAGEYVPDSVTNAMVRERLAAPDVSVGFLLDGYPRTLAQVHVLDEILAEHGEQLDRVVELTIEREQVVDRLLRRSAIEGRADDNEATIRRRLEVYEEQTSALTRGYEQRGLLARVDGDGTVEEVTGRVLEALGA